MRHFCLWLLTVIVFATVASAQSFPVMVTPGSGGVVNAQVLGDIDGDGVSDFVLDEPGSVSDPPMATIYSGAGLTELYCIVGTFGVPMNSRAVGDVDGNGLADVWTSTGLYCGLSGAMLASSSSFPNAFGPLPVGNVDGVPGNELAFWIGPGGSTPGVFIYSGTGLLAYQAAVPNIRDATTIERIEDLNADGIEDFVVATTDAVGGSIIIPMVPIDPGWVGIMSGVDGSVLRSFQGGVGSRLGGGIAVLPDINGDGVSDVVVHAPHGPAFGSPNANGLAGQIYVICGASQTMSLFWECDFACLSPGHINVDNKIVRRLSDYDGDGVPDFFVGPGFFVHSGRTGERIGGHGFYVPSELGDIDGDGTVEVLGVLDGGGSALPAIVYSARPDDVEPFGTPTCSWGWPELPMIGATSGLAWNFEFVAGSTVTVNGSGAPPGSRAILMIGTSNTHWGPRLLPYDLGVGGLSGCELLVAPDILERASESTHGGRTFFSREFVVPPVIAGVSVYLQWLMVDVLGGPPIVALSQGLSVTFE